MASVAGSSVAHFAVSVKNAEGQSDPAVRGRLKFVSTTDTTVCEFGPVPLGAGRTFDVPAWPLVQALRCDVTLDGYRAQPSTQFIPRNGERIDVPLIAMRDPAHWVPAFQPLAELDPDRFARFLRVLQASDSVGFVKQPPVLGRLTDAYDNLAGDEGQHAKMALLNLHALLTDETDPVTGVPWFEHVRGIVRIDRERLVGECDEQLYLSVHQILHDLNKFGYGTELSPTLHLGNFPDPAAVKKLITVKKRFGPGTLQLTAAKTDTAGETRFFVDVDMDEHGQLALHTIDLFKHKFNGGTHPIDIHEFIVAHSASANSKRVSDVNLGYELVRR